MAVMQAQTPRAALQPVMRGAATLPRQFQNAGPLLRQRPGPTRAARAQPISAKLAKSQGGPQQPVVSTVDIVSSGMGAMVCTSFFVSRGQDPFEALTVTACSIVVALVLNQLLFSNE